MNTFKKAIKYAYFVTANEMKRANVVGQTTPQSYEDYLVKGPQHAEEQENIDLSKHQQGHIIDYKLALECLRNEYKKETQDSLAWDKCGCHNLPQELQLDLRREFVAEVGDFYSSAEFDASIMVTSSARARELVSFGFDHSIVSEALEAIQMKRFAKVDDIKSRKICIIGPPSEKRTELCRRLSDFCGIEHYTVEKMIEYGVNHGFIKSEKTQDTKIPEKLIEIFYHHIHDNHDGYIVEGYPISIEQVESLMCDLVVFVDVDLEATVKYQSNRRWCSTCMRIYNLIDSPPIHNPNKCDRCGSNLEVRPEDKAEFVKDSYYTYHKQVQDILRELRKTNAVLEMKTDKEVEDMAIAVDRIFTGKDEKPDYRKKNVSIYR